MCLSVYLLNYSRVHLIIDLCIHQASTLSGLFALVLAASCQTQPVFSLSKSQGVFLHPVWKRRKKEEKTGSRSPRLCIFAHMFCARDPDSNRLVYILTCLGCCLQRKHVRFCVILDVGISRQKLLVFLHRFRIFRLARGSILSGSPSIHGV